MPRVKMNQKVETALLSVHIVAARDEFVASSAESDRQAPPVFEWRHLLLPFDSAQGLEPVETAASAAM
jgi:hypothetical protein